MKEALRIALIVYSLGLLNSAWGQSTFVFGNPRNAPVFDALGQRLFGTQYSAMLYGGVSQDSLVQAFGQLNTPLAPAFFTSLIGDQAGYFLGNDTSGSIAYFREPSAVEGGPPLWVQVRAWDNRPDSP